MRRNKPHPLAAVAEVLLICAALVGMTVLLRMGHTRYLRAAYPDNYRETVCEAAEKYDVPPSLIMAVIRTESSFHPDAVSTAGAVGLMQITEPTLEWVQMRTGGDTVITADDLTTPEINIDVGVRTLVLLAELFENGDTQLAAYNAGAGNVREWLQDERYSADGITLHDIPFEETAQYVQRVRKAQKMYQTLYGLE